MDVYICMYINIVYIEASKSDEGEQGEQEEANEVVTGLDPYLALIRRRTQHLQHTLPLPEQIVVLVQIIQPV